jgi:hypothetical protein
MFYLCLVASFFYSPLEVQATLNEDKIMFCCNSPYFLSPNVFGERRYRYLIVKSIDKDTAHRSVIFSQMGGTDRVKIPGR